MLPSRALRGFRSNLRPRSSCLRSQNLPKFPYTIIPSRYCSACDSATVTSKGATSTTNPPTPPADHRQLGIDQELFTTSIYSPGSPIFLPNGTRMFKALTEFLSAQYAHFGFDEVITPTIYKKSLWEKSGHWENYAEDMYSVSGRGASGEQEGHQAGEGEEYGLKPMNCPGHCLIFASKMRSYRDLPIRYADFSPLHRNEVSGSLSGLTRVRRFHQDDGHIFCRPSQIEREISNTLEFVRMVYSALRLGPYRLALSTRPKDHYIGTEEEWDNAEAALKKSLDASGQKWTINDRDGAFYGPKIDIILKDSDGKEHQTATIQLDFQLPKRFNLGYQAPAPEVEAKGQTTEDPNLLGEEGTVTPVLIHRAILGSVERLMALLIEHYNGHYPFWLNPRKAVIITVSDNPGIVDYATKVREQLSRHNPSDHIRTSADATPEEPKILGISTPDGKAWPAPRSAAQFPIDLDDSPRSLKKKILEAKLKRYGAIIVVGARNKDAGDVAVDLSGIPDFHNFIQTDNQILGALQVDPANAWNSTEKLKDVIIKPEQLRGVFNSMLESYI